MNVHNHHKIELLGKTVFERIVFTPPLKATEWMENEACLIYSREGSAKMHSHNKSERFAQDESVFMKCGNYINHWQIREEDSRNEAVAIHFYPDVISLIFETNIPKYLLEPVNAGAESFVKIDKSSVLKSYVEGLMVYFDNPVLFNEDSIKLKLRELISLLYGLNSNGIREILSDLFNPDKREFKSIIARHLYDDLSLEELATLTHLSLASFKRKFKEHYELSPGQYLLQKKLERAGKLLRTTEDRIADVGFDCGFNDLSSFTRAFSKKYGVSPTSYRNSK